MNEKLQNYVKQMQAKGISEEEIKNNLKQVGWDEQTLEQLFAETPPPNPKDYQLTSEEMKQLDTRAILLFLINHGISVAVLFVILPIIFLAFAALELPEYAFLFILITPLLFLLIIYLIAKLEYHFYRYQLNEDGFYKERGIIAKKYVTIPYEKIQNIDIHQNVISRILGLYSVQIQTAGTSSVAHAEGVLPGVNKDEAERLKTELLRRSRLTGNRNF